jgi:hypothetical protein
MDQQDPGDLAADPTKTLILWYWMSIKRLAVSNLNIGNFSQIGISGVSLMLTSAANSDGPKRPIIEG